MPSDVTIVVADPQRVAAFRDELKLAGRVVRFSSSNLASVLESVRANQPGLVAIDAAFAKTSLGVAFVDRIEKLDVPALEIHLVARLNGAWVTQPLSQTPPAPRVDVKSSGLNTRRAPRFLVIDSPQVVVDNGKANLVDLSALGAQVVSQRVLRPNQAVQIVLPDASEALRVNANIKWSMLEKPKVTADAYYRAGVEFTDADKAALDGYCRRHCSGDPIPYRG